MEILFGIVAGSLVAACWPKQTRQAWRLLTGGYLFKDTPPPGP